MSDWTYSIVIIVPASLKGKAETLSCALGHDVLPGNTFSVPLSSNGTEITHYGCRTAAKQEFLDILNHASTGNLPEGFGIPLEDVSDVLEGQIISYRENAENHFQDVLEEEGLRLI